MKDDFACLSLWAHGVESINYHTCIMKMRLLRNTLEARVLGYLRIHSAYKNRITASCESQVFTRHF